MGLKVSNQVLSACDKKAQARLCYATSSYYGMQRFRGFIQAFPELKDKRWWLTEIRPRSDEDNRCQRIFRESLVMAHCSLMAVCQPEIDALNHHQLFAISGGIYQSDGKGWGYQWADAGGNHPDRKSPYNRRRLEVGHTGVMYRILAEGLLENPLVLHHGSSKATDDEDSFYTSARVMDQAYERRRALKEGRKVGGFLGIGADYPEVEGIRSNPSPSSSATFRRNKASR